VPASEVETAVIATLAAGMVVLAATGHANAKNGTAATAA
jgi:hypothetical protein